MADTVQASIGTEDGAVFATDDVSSVHYPVSKITIGANGLAGEYLVGGAGAVAAGVQRVTLASDDPAVVDLAAIEVLQTSIDGTLTTIDADTSTIAGAIKAEDAPHASTDTGVMVFGVRNDTIGTFASLDGDYTPMQMDAQGNVRVALNDASGTELDFRQEAENVNAADHGILVFGRDYESTPDKYRMLRVDDSGYLEVRVEGPTGDEYIEPHTTDFDSGGGTDNTSAFGIAFPASGGGVVCPGDATNGMTVNLGTNNDVTVAGDALTALQKIDDPVFVDNGAFTLTNPA